MAKGDINFLSDNNTDCRIEDIEGKNQRGSVVAVVNDVDVSVQDQTTDPIIIYFNQVTNSTTLSGPISIDDRVINVVSATGISVGSYIILFDPTSVRFSTFFVTAVASLAITLDSPTDFAYPAGTNVDVSIVDMNVDGSSTEQVFGLRGVGAPPGIDLKMDVTRIMFECTTSSAVTLDLFANITALTRGILIRHRNGRYKNILNVKSNLEIAGTMFDWTPYAATNPVQGIDGFTSRLTFTRLGVVVRLPIGEDLEAWVQDALQTVTSLRMYAEGHIVED